MGNQPSRSMPGDVVLRDVTEADLSIYYEHQLDPRATEMAAFPARARTPFIAHRTRILEDETVTAKTILYQGQVAGNVVAFNQSGEREVGYWLGRAFWGKGIATKALSLFLDVVSERPLYAIVASHNLGSIKVLHKCGFVIEREEAGAPNESGDPIAETVLTLCARSRSPVISLGTTLDATPTR